jgi:hypothetical protein
MAQVAPTETAFYVKQALSISESKGLYLLVKQTLPYFSDALQKEIRSALL